MRFAGRTQEQRSGGLRYLTHICKREVGTEGPYQTHRGLRKVMMMMILMMMMEKVADELIRRIRLRGHPSRDIQGLASAASAEPGLYRQGDRVACHVGLPPPVLSEKW